MYFWKLILGLASFHGISFYGAFGGFLLFSYLWVSCMRRVGGTDISYVMYLFNSFVNHLDFYGEINDLYWHYFDGWCTYFI